MTWNWALLLIGALVIPLVLTGLPVAIALMMSSIILLWIAVGPIKAMYLVSQEIGHFWSSWTMLAVPLFVLMGELLFVGGAASEIFDMVSKWLRRVRGGQALVSTGACAVFASMCGSSSAGTSAMAIVTIPEMLKRGYSPRLSTGCVAAAGALAHLIPPSILMVVYASLVEISPGRALMAAVVPGIILAVYYAAIVVIWTTVHPSAAPQEPTVNWKERIVSLKTVWQPASIVMAVLGTLYLGIATATEAAAMGALVALLMAVPKTHFDFRKIGRAFVGAARISCFIMLIAVSGKVLALTMTYYMIPQNAVRLLLDMDLSPVVSMILIQVLYLVLGGFIEPIGVMVVTLPVVAPVLAGLGFDPYWFGVMLMVNFEMALVTPPMGTQLYIIKGVVPQVPLKDILRGALVFLIGAVMMLITLYLFPQLALWLPNRMLGS